MPYRRLPNTDEARIRALQTLIEQARANDVCGRVFSYEIVSEAQSLLNPFKSAQQQYKQALRRQASANKKLQDLGKNARLYLSHFIQVLNLAVIRKEIKEEQKSLYGLNPIDYSVPDLLSDPSTIQWGEKIIGGEYKRIQQGGVAIYTPTIAKVKVHFDMFKDASIAQRMFQKNTTRTLDSVAEQRPAIDAAISEAWNQIENCFKDLPGAARIEACKQFGVLYYYRKGEKRP